MDVKAIDVLNVSYGYVRSQDVLSEINISVEHSTITAILGKSGSGKSTLLQIINGMIKPREGEVRLHGVPIDYHNIHSLRLKMGYVVQHIGLFPHMTVAGNISIGFQGICGRGLVYSTGTGRIQYKSASSPEDHN